MKRKVLIAICIVIILITFKLLFNILVNSILINKYNNGEYSESHAQILTVLNFPQSYVANYNYGNILYQNGKFEEAKEEYKNALNGIVPKEEECNIRINYALAICKTVQVDEENQNSIQKAIEQYESAIDILTEKGCASKNDNNGHNRQAQILKQDIQKEIDRLKKLQKQNNNEEEQNNNKNEEQIETIENKIQNIKQEAIQEQREVESRNKNYNNYNFTYDRIQKNW